MLGIDMTSSLECKTFRHTYVFDKQIEGPISAYDTRSADAADKTGGGGSR